MNLTIQSFFLLIHVSEAGEIEQNEVGTVFWDTLYFSYYSIFEALWPTK
jgi:hypothetical protein